MIDKTGTVFLKQLLEHRGWKIVKKHLEENLVWLTEKILDDEDESLKEEIKLSKREMLIKWRRYNKMLIDLPDILIKSLEEPSSIEQPSNFDSYFNEKDFEKK